MKIFILMIFITLLAPAISRADDTTVALFGMNATQLAAALSDNASKKFPLVEIEISRSWGQISYSALWRKVGKQFTIIPHYGENLEQFRSLLGTVRSQNLRPGTLNVANGGIFASTWQPNDDSRKWLVETELTSDQYQAYFNRVVALGYRLKSLQAYFSADNQLKFAAIFDTHGEEGWGARHNMTSADFATNDASFKAQGYYLVSLEAYNDGTQIRYAGRWLQAGTPAPAYYANLDMTLAELQANIKQQAQISGRSLAQISAFTKAGLTHFAALWE